MSFFWKSEEERLKEEAQKKRKAELLEGQNKLKQALSKIKSLNPQWTMIGPNGPKGEGHLKGVCRDGITVEMHFSTSSKEAMGGGAGAVTIKQKQQDDSDLYLYYKGFLGVHGELDSAHLIRDFIAPIIIKRAEELEKEEKERLRKIQETKDRFWNS